MKKFILLIIFVLSGFSFAQTSNDIVVYPINTKFLNSLVLELCNQMTSNSGVVKKSHPVTFKCAEYQSSYQAKFSVCTHNNTEHFRGYLLESVVNRREVFNKPEQLMGSMAEICTFATVDYGVTTYGELAKHIMSNFFESSPHKKAILNDYPYGDFSCTQGVYKGQKGVYVTGMFSR